jgi:chemotaxis protein MotB
MNTSSKVQEAVAGYFRDPAGQGKLSGTEKAGQGKGGAVVSLKREDMPRLRDEIDKALQSLPQFEKMKRQVSMTVTSEGLRIELLETEKGMFFDSGSARPTGAGVELLQALAGELGKLPNRVLIEGHTDARPFTGTPHYSNWELSTDRANQARVVMQGHGLKPSQIQQVRGFADQNLRDPIHPNDAANRRVSVLVPYLESAGNPTHDDPAPKQEGAAKAERKPSH